MTLKQSKVLPEFNDQDLPTSMGNAQNATLNVLPDEELPTFIDNSVYNMNKQPDYLSPITKTKDVAPPPPLPLNRQLGGNMYEDIREIPKYLELEEIPIQDPRADTCQQDVRSGHIHTD